jgi:hypothetical protein
MDALGIVCSLSVLAPSLIRDAADLVLQCRGRKPWTPDATIQTRIARYFIPVLDCKFRVNEVKKMLAPTALKWTKLRILNGDTIQGTDSKATQTTPYRRDRSFVRVSATREYDSSKLTEI